MKNRNIPYGYCYNNGTIIVNPTESAIVGEVCLSYLEGQSLLKIAEWLNERLIEYLPGIYGWNKARVKRILEDERYLGTDSYPRLISEEMHTAIQGIKNGRNTQKETDRQAEIYKLTTPILCPICQSKMKRRFDSKRKCQTRWMCENLECRIGIDKDDTELLQDITEAMNYLIDHPELVHEVAPEAIEPSIETRKINNEIARMLDNIEVDRDAIRKKMLEAVSQKYQDIDSAAYTTQKLKADLSNMEKLESFSAVTTEKIVKAIILYNNKTIAFILENDQIIRKESTNGSHSKTEGGSSNTADN